MKKEELRHEMVKLDWMKILREAVESRPSSWSNGLKSVREWRNASYELCTAVLREMLDKGLVPSFLEGEKERL